jgi:hypothetical protein
MSTRALHKRLDVLNASQEAIFLFVVINRPPVEDGIKITTSEQAIDTPKS